jgi:hypothetical protein
LAEGVLGEVVGRIASDDAGAAIDAVIGVWEAVRHGGETLGRTVRRLGIDAFAAHLEAQLAERWATGPEPEPDPDAESDLVPR